MSALWRCGVCETVNDGGTTCSACGAPLTRRSATTTAVRARVTRPAPPVPAPAPVAEPVRRAINREPVSEDEWAEYEADPGTMILPIPGGCLMVGGRGSW